MRQLLSGFSLCLILLSGQLAFTIAASQPPGRNIVYIHVPAALSALVCFCVLLFCSIQYLRTKQDGYDFAAAASAEVGLVFAAVLNATGSIFAHAEWNSLWTPSPRLISSAAMLLLYVGYCLLRASLAEHPRKKKICSVFGIIAFIDVPLVVISARLIRDIHQPSVSFDTGWQRAALGLAICGTIILALVLTWLRSSILAIKDQLDANV